MEPGPTDYGPWTFESTKAIADAFGVSSRKLENAVRGLTGALGTMVLQGADVAMRMNNPNLPQRPSPTLADLPVTKAFVSRFPQPSSGPEQELWKMYSEIGAKVSALRKLRGEGPASQAKADEIERDLRESGDLERLGIAKGAVNLFKRQNEAERRLMLDTTLTAEQKRARIDEQLSRKNVMAREQLDRALRVEAARSLAP
jgi:hypothetical protein